MKNRKIKFGILIVIILSLFFTIKVNALSDFYITKNDDVSIRYKTETSKQGLRFTAELSEDVKNNAHGFYIAYGHVSIGDLRTSINEAKGKDFKLNGKKVYKVEVGGVKPDNTYSVVVTGIPEKGYNDKVSVVGYVMVSGVIRFVEAATTKSILEVALSTLNTGETNSTLTNIRDNATHKVVLGENALKDLELNNTFYEYNHHKLKVLFSEDFYEKIKVDFTLALIDEELYSFFTDPIMKNKWGFLLDYFSAITENNNLKNQVIAVKENNRTVQLRELHYALHNFFNEQNGKINDDIIDFTNLENYLHIKDFNESVYINPNEYELYQVGDQIELPEADTDLEGYVFDHYLINNKKYNAGNKYTIADTKVILNKVFTEKDCEITFIDSYGNINQTITIPRNSYIEEFPEINKAGYVLVHFTDSLGNIVDEETLITSDMTLHAVYKIAITDIYFNIDKENYKVLEASEHITYNFYYDTFNVNTLKIVPKEGYAFSKDVVIVVVYNGKQPVVEVNVEYSPEYIEYVMDDPNWSTPY